MGWGKCLPPAVLTNADLATFLETDDEWIASRTGMRERRISHVPLGEVIHVAAARALACAGMGRRRLDLIIVGSTLGDELAPNVASGTQKRLRREERGGHGREHRLHELPLRALVGDRPHPHRRHPDRAGGGRGGPDRPSWTGRTETPPCSSATAAAPR